MSVRESLFNEFIEKIRRKKKDKREKVVSRSIRWYLDDISNFCVFLILFFF